ncbi:MAG TPA: DUF4215 domain-containing protein [Kofleriaceae bacterium]|nr:DUF4215 domain-containing protein [Kofleriaceae bacterium]
MLERFTDQHRQRRRLGPAASLSIAAHVVAFAALLVSATWQIDKLETSEPPVLLASAPGAALPLPDTGEEPPPVKKPRPPKRPSREMVQPEDSTPEEEPEPASGEPGSGDTEGPGLGLAQCPEGAICDPAGLHEMTQPVCGDGRSEGAEECDDGGRIGGDGCSASCKREREVVVRSHMIEGHRIAGDPQIPAPESVRTMMARMNQNRLNGAIKMCLTQDGAVRSLSVLRSTGYPEYDQLLTSRMSGWRYRPYQLSDGKAVPVCTVVNFIYVTN